MAAGATAATVAVYRKDLKQLEFDLASATGAPSAAASVPLTRLGGNRLACGHPPA